MPGMKLPGNLFLIGLMGVGKTTVGRLLAQQSSKFFLDCDHAIEANSGVTIEHIFSVEGEAGFRRRETAMLKLLCEQHNVVLATGGGVILNQQNWQYLHHRGHVVYLRAGIEFLYQRLRNDKKRPLLPQPNRYQSLQQLWQQRDPLYRALAHSVIDVEQYNRYALVQQIIRHCSLSS